MISKTSLFNKGIYKSTIRRYMWGSVLYFILLFLATALMIMLNENPELPNVYWSARAQSTLLSNEYMIIAMLLSIAVPSITGLLIFRFIHSKKASVFIHSLPVKRSANYISATLAALTLMIIPVVLNTAVLMIMSVWRYSLVFSVTDCLVWMLLNLLSIFVFFSCSCFVSVLTGNSFAMLGLNVLFHAVPMIFAAVFTVISEMFLHGFSGDDTLLQKCFETSFITRIPTIMTNWIYADDKVLREYGANIGTFISAAVVLYVISGVLYLKRRMETAEEVAGFNCLNVIFKQLVTFIGAVSAFAIFSQAIYSNAAAIWVGVVIISAVVYFGAEMLLRKSFRVWSSYKGYIAFAAVFAVIMSCFAFTGFFGFEAYVPGIDDVENVAVYNYYSNKKPVVSNEEVIAKAISAHSRLTENPEIVVPREYDTRIHFEYELKNGKKVHRTYRIDTEALFEIMDGLYENKEYKEQSIEFYTPAEKYLDASLEADGVYIELEGEKVGEIVECIKSDLENLKYSQIDNGGWSIRADIRFIAKIDNKDASYNENSEHIRYMAQNINMNFEKTVQWMKDNGYWESLKVKNEGTIYIAKDWEFLPFEDRAEENQRANFLKIEEGEEIQEILDFIEAYKPGYVPEEMKLRVYHAYEGSDKGYVMLFEAPKDSLGEIFPDKEFDKLILQ